MNPSAHRAAMVKHVDSYADEWRGVLEDPEKFAVGNCDPFTNAYVLSRGIVGTRCDIPTVASPLLKHAFDLRAGASRRRRQRLPVYAVRVVDGTRARLGALAREIVTILPAQCAPFRASSHVLEVRGHAGVLDGVLRPLPPGPMSVLRLLARQPAQVVSRGDLLATLPGDSSDEHAVETTVGRLRPMLGDARIVRTVVKRGYRMACEPSAARAAPRTSTVLTRPNAASLV